MHAYQPDRLRPAPEESGFIASLLAQHPALLGGAVLSLVVMTSIFINATYFQDGKHPAPMFATRTDAPEATKVRTARVEAGQKSSANTNAEPIPSSFAASSPEILSEIQSALSVRGYYEGGIDGKYGSKTRNAIVAFQRDHSLEQTGQPSFRLLSQVLMSASARPEQVPVPKAMPEPKRDIASLIPKPVKTVKVGAQQPEVADGLVAQIQSGLRNYGYTDLAVDGKAGRNTKTAIRRFQLDYGMEITGEPSQNVLNKLRKIGAFQQG